MGSYVKSFGRRGSGTNVRMRLEPGLPYRFGHGYFLLMFHRLESDGAVVYALKLEYYDTKKHAVGGINEGGHVFFRAHSSLTAMTRELDFHVHVRAIEFSEQCQPVQAWIDVTPVAGIKIEG